jgi:hypothetical protein
MRPVLVVLLVGAAGAACSDKSGGATKPPPPGQTGSGGAAVNERCKTAVDKLFALLKRQGYNPRPAQWNDAVDGCTANPDDPAVACILAAGDDAALERCVKPEEEKNDPLDPLVQATQNLRTYFFVHETFTDQKIALTPATPCCQFPTKKCPPETAPNEYLTDILQLDLSKEREFQYRFESTGRKAVIEAVVDRDCDGTAVTYRRELEWRADGNMHITVLNPPDGSD